jgi:hypothetical protein
MYTPFPELFPAAKLGSQLRKFLTFLPDGILPADVRFPAIRRGH